MGKKLSKVLCALLTAVILFAGFNMPAEVEASQTTFRLDCGNSAGNIRSAIQKVDARFQAYDKMLFTNLDMSKVDIKVEFYTSSGLGQTITPTMESENSCYIRMPYVAKDSTVYDYWGLYDTSSSTANGITTVTIKMASVQAESKLSVYSFSLFNQEVQEAVKKALPGEHVLIDAGDFPSLTKSTMQAIAANREIDITFIRHKGATPYMITIASTDTVPTDVDYAGFDAYLVGLFGKDAVDMNIIAGTNQLVDLSKIEDYNEANQRLLTVIKFAPENVTLVINATTFGSFTKNVMKALVDRPDLKVRVYFTNKKTKEIYYSTVPTGQQLLTDAGGELIYMGFTGYVGGKYGATFYEKVAEK